jgi:hypothetical protein
MGPNGNNGWMVLSRRASTIEEHGDFEYFVAAASFPKTLLHPSIADDVWVALARNDLEVAVFIVVQSLLSLIPNHGTEPGQPA